MLCTTAPAVGATSTGRGRPVDQTRYLSLLPLGSQEPARTQRLGVTSDEALAAALHPEPGRCRRVRLGFSAAQSAAPVDRYFFRGLPASLRFCRHVPSLFRSRGCFPPPGEGTYGPCLGPARRSAIAVPPFSKLGGVIRGTRLRVLSPETLGTAPDERTGRPAPPDGPDNTRRSSRHRTRSFSDRPDVPGCPDGFDEPFPSEA